MNIKLLLVFFIFSIHFFEAGVVAALLLVFFLVFELKHHGKNHDVSVNYNMTNVVQFGAAGDGTTDDSQAFLKAWKAVCEATTPTAMLVPTGRTFLLKPVNFQGPCTSSNVGVKILGKIVAPGDIDAWKHFDKKNWLVFSNVRGLAVQGDGQIDGQGAAWWSQASDADSRPKALGFYNCDNLQLTGLTHINSASSHLHFVDCNHASISQLQMTAPEDSPNTDGIDITRTTNVRIQNCKIATGDDCIAIGPGSSYIHITNIDCGPGHGISIGSLGADGRTDTVEEVHVQNCNLKGTTNGVRIKTWQGGSGYARKISFQGITLDSVHNPIFIDQYYCNGKKGCKNQTSAVQVSDVSYQGVHGTSATEVAIKLSCSESVACSNLVFEDIGIRSANSDKMTQSSCYNAHGRSTNTLPGIEGL